VAAGDDEGESWEVDGLIHCGLALAGLFFGIDEVGGDVGFDVGYCDKRGFPGEAEGAGGVDADHEGADEAGAGGDRDGVYGEFVEGLGWFFEVGLVEGFFYDGDD